MKYSVTSELKIPVWSKRFASLAMALVVLQLTAVGCGGQAYRVGDGNVPVDGDGSGHGGGDDDSEEDTDDSVYPAISTTFKVTGEKGNVPSFTLQDVITDDVLKVKIIAGAASQIDIYNANQFSHVDSDVSFEYDCVRYKITIGNQSWTPTLSLSGQGNRLCPGALTEATKNFSSVLTSGHGPIDVKVEAAASDAYCYGSLWYAGVQVGQDLCGLRTVAKSHTVTGTIEITTNDAGS